MRISTANAYDLSVDNLSKGLTDLASVQEQMSTKKRITARATTRPVPPGPNARSRTRSGWTPTSARSMPARTP